MTPKEALEGIKQRINYALNKPENVDTPERQKKRIDKSTKQIYVIEQALNELEDYKHNYKALKEFYDNSVAYGSKIQNELNELKQDVARFLYLMENPFNNYFDEIEYSKLKEKLAKAGKQK